MNESYDLNSILNAIDNINNKRVKKILPNVIGSAPKFFADSKIPPDVDKLINEAEAYKNNLVLQSEIKPSTFHNEIPKENNINSNNFKEIQTQIIDDLYSKLSKRIKKNTLKIIFNLNLKIQNLEKKIETFQTKKNQQPDKDKLILKEEVVSPLNASDPSINKLKQVVFKNNNSLKNEIVTSLKIQDSTISLLNIKIQNFKKTEESLRLQIIDLEQDKSLLLKKDKKFEELNVYKNNLNVIKKRLHPIYKQVEKQKKSFLTLKEYSLKLISFGNELIKEKNELKNEIKKVNDEFSTYKNEID